MAAVTVQNLIKSSLRLIGVLSVGEEPTAQENQDALQVLNDMIDSWSNENLMIFHKVLQTQTLTADQQVYTAGSGGDFNITRPMKIEDPIIRLTNGADSNDYPLKVISQKEWSLITEKNTDADIPQLLFYEDNFPLGNVYLWPKPNSAKTLLFYSWEPLTTYSDLTTTLSLPPGYQRALRYNFALELAPEYGVQASQEIVGIAMESKGLLKVKNSESHYLRVDDAVSARADRFNYNTGDY